MLALTRRVGECVWIDNDICVVVHAVEEGRVRLAFDAPADVSILRGELRDVPPSRATESGDGHGRRPA